MTAITSTWETIAPRWSIIIPAALLGAAAGIALYYAALSDVTAVAIIQTGRVGGVEENDNRITPQLVIQRRSGPQALSDRIITMEFAERVAKRIGDDTVADDLGARQYGGAGKLKSRQISDGTLVEIRASFRDRQKALAVVNAAAELAIEDDSSYLAASRAQFQRRLDGLRKDLADATNVADTLRSRIGNGSDNSSAAIVAAQKQVSDLQQRAFALQNDLSTPTSQDSGMFAKASISKPVVSSWLVAMIAGAVAGAAAGYAFSISRFSREGAGASYQK
jgi:uncharacterized protein YfiM (DUF2279 family)